MGNKSLVFPDEFSWVEGFLVPLDSNAHLDARLEILAGYNFNEMDDYIDQEIMYESEHVIVTQDDVEVETGIWKKYIYIYLDFEMEEVDEI
jgi:hypothetical protein